MTVKEILKNLNILNEGKTWENFWKAIPEKKRKAYSKIKNREKGFAIRRLRKIDPTSTDETIGKYTQWLFKYDVENKLPYIRVIQDTLEYFEKNKRKFNIKDITRFSPKTLVKMVETKRMEQGSDKLKSRPDLVYKGWAVKLIKNKRDACSLGVGTKWCITGDYGYFTSYNRNYKIFYVVYGNKKWAVIIARKQHTPSALPNKVYTEKDTMLSLKRWTEDNKVPQKIINYMVKK